MTLRAWNHYFSWPSTFSKANQWKSFLLLRDIDSKIDHLKSLTLSEIMVLTSYPFFHTWEVKNSWSRDILGEVQPIFALEWETRTTTPNQVKRKGVNKKNGIYVYCSYINVNRCSVWIYYMYINNHMYIYTTYRAKHSFWSPVWIEVILKRFSW